MHADATRGVTILAMVVGIGLAPAAALGQSEPLVLDRSVTEEADGVRLSMQIERNPVVAGRPVWITTKLTNTGDSDILWAHGRCDTAVIVSGVMRDETWREGEPYAISSPSDLAWHTKRERIDGGPEIALEIEPEAAIGSGGYGCSEILSRDRVAPGKTLTDRSRWNGFAQWQLGPPPDGVATVTGTFGTYKREGDRGRPTRTLQAALEVLVLGGLAPDALHPQEVIDAAQADEGFAALMETIDVGDGNDPVLWYDPELGLWEVGVLEVSSSTLKVALVDPMTGDIIAIVERARVRGQDPGPRSD